MSDHSFQPAPLNMRTHRIPYIHTRFCNIPGDSCLPAQCHIITNLNMSGHTGLACKNTVIADLCAARNAHLRNNKAVFADFHIMTEMHKIINLGTTVHNRIIHGAIIHGTSCSDLYIVLQNCPSQLANMCMMSLGIRGKTKSLSADHCMRPQDHPIAENTVFMNDSARIQLTIFPDFYVVPDIAIGVNHSPVTNFRTVLNHSICHDAYVFTDDGLITDYCCGMDACRKFNLRMKYINQIPKCPAAILYKNQSFGILIRQFIYQNSACLHFLYMFCINAPGKSHMMRPCNFRTAYIFNDCTGIAIYGASHHFRQFCCCFFHTISSSSGCRLSPDCALSATITVCLSFATGAAIIFLHPLKRHRQCGPALHL